MPKTAKPWSLTSLREKLIKIGAKVVTHGRYLTFQLAEVAVLRQMFADILSLIARLRSPPALATSGFERLLHAASVVAHCSTPQKGDPGFKPAGNLTNVGSKCQMVGLQGSRTGNLR